MKLNTLVGFFVPSRKEPETCRSCQQPFICGASITGCWCTQLKLTDETRASLRAKYTGCLCRSCLEKAASANIK